jgi:hypothetical protein
MATRWLSPRPLDERKIVNALIKDRHYFREADFTVAIRLDE